jgi:hypothetical protein
METDEIEYVDMPINREGERRFKQRQKEFAESEEKMNNEHFKKEVKE